MPTTIKVLPDSAFLQAGPVITPTQVHVTDPGDMLGRAVWDHPGEWRVTTPHTLEVQTGQDWGRLLPGVSPNAKISDSGDSRKGYMDFHIKPDGGESDTIRFTVQDAADSKYGADFTVNGKTIHLAGGQDDGNLFVFDVKTTADNIHFSYDTHAPHDGFTMLTCAVAAEQQADAMALHADHFAFG